MRKILVTGSGGLIGSEAVRFFDRGGSQVVGIDNNMRREFFGPSGDTSWLTRELLESTRSVTSRAMNWSYPDQHREGDHICYYSDLNRIRSHYPEWDITINLEKMLEEIVASWETRIRSTAYSS